MADGTDSPQQQDTQSDQTASQPTSNSNTGVSISNVRNSVIDIHPDAVTSNRISMIIACTLCACIGLSLISIVFVKVALPLLVDTTNFKDAAGINVDMILTVFTTSLGTLTGLLMPSPLKK